MNTTMPTNTTTRMTSNQKLATVAAVILLTVLWFVTGLAITIAALSSADWGSM